MVDAILTALKAKQAEWAQAAIAAPTDKTEYGYGHAAGVYSGLVMAEQVYLDLLRDRDQKSRDL